MENRKAFLLEEISWNIYNKIPITVIEINTNNLFPVLFKYKGKKYSNLIFSERLNKIEFIN